MISLFISRIEKIAMLFSFYTNKVTTTTNENLLGTAFVFIISAALSNGVPIESVSKILGHTSLKTSQIHAKVLDKKISYPK